MKKVLTALRGGLVDMFTPPLPWWLFPGEWWDRASARREQRRKTERV